MAFFECSLPSCREIAIVCGSAKVYHWQVGYDEYVTGNVFTVESISPAPIPIAIPAATPISIIDAVSRSASLIWPSPESAANQVRQAVECLMDDVGVPAKDPKGKTIFLHHRIVEFQKSDQDCGTILLATKWLGNIGSHVGTLERSDVLDAFEMFEYVLESQYGTAKAEILAKAAAINAAKGPTKIQ